MLKPAITPVPVRAALTEPPWGDITLNWPLFAPMAVGLKVTEMVQVAPALRALVQVLVCAKPSLTAICGDPVVPPPAFESVNTMGGALALVTSTEPRSDEVGVSLNIAVPPPSGTLPPSEWLVVLPPHPAATSAPAKPNAANRSN